MCWKFYHIVTKNLGILNMRRFIATFLLIWLLPIIAESSEFDDFISKNTFKKIPSDLITFLLEDCQRVQNADGKLSYTEIKLLRDGVSVMDFNKHHVFLNSYQSKNYNLPFFSITLWSWYKNVALKAGDFEYLSSYKQSMERRNMIVSKQFFVNLAKDGRFALWLEQDTDASGRFFSGEVQIKNSQELLACFDG